MTHRDEPFAPRGTGWPFSIVAVGFIVAALIVFPPSARRADRAQMAEGYSRIVNQLFIGNRWLETAPPHESSSRSADDGPVIRMSVAAQEQDRIQEFVRNSYLARDLVQERPPIWTIDNGQVIRLDPAAHRIALPSTPPQQWTGNLLFRNSAASRIEIVLRGSRGDITLEPPDFNSPMSDADRRRFSIGGGRQSVQAAYVRIQEGPADDAGRPIADLMLWGSTPVVTPAEQERVYYQVHVDGELVEHPRRRAVAPGGSIRIVGQNNRVDETLSLTETVASSPEMSLYRPWGGERQRAATTEHLARAIENSLNRIAASGAMGDNTSEEVRLTIDGEMEDRLAGLLRDYVNDNRAFVGDEYQIGVTVMDAISGDILALGSAINLPEDTSSTEDEPPLDINFRRLQVGSAAKPPITAAILNWRPDLGTLVLRERGEGGELRRLLGVEFRPRNTLGDTRASCDFNCFIETSNNRYATALMLLASAPGNGRTVATPGGYELNGVVRNERPYSIFETINRSGEPVFSPAHGSVVTRPWHRNLRELFDIEYQFPSPSRAEQASANCQRADGRLGDDVFNAFIWRDLLNSRYSMADPCAFYGATPERENFALDRQYDFERRMLPVMIGGGEARWTNVTLAQTYARIVTGERVSARIFPRQGRGAERTRGQFEMDDGARDRLTHAMTLVTQADGTAHAFSRAANWEATRDALASRNAVLGIFAKTGTPAIETPVYEPASRAINLLIRTNLLRLRDGALVLQVGARTVPITPETSGDVTTILRDDIGARDALRSARASVQRVRQLLLWHNSLTEAERARNFQIEDGRVLVRLVRPDDVDTLYGKVFVFVVGRYPANVALDGRRMAANGRVRPQRAYVVAINIQSEVEERDGAGGSVASRLGARIFNELLRDPLVRDERR